MKIFQRKHKLAFSDQWGDRGKIYRHKKSRTILFVGEDLSDFLVWRKDGVAAYELATVVDDHLMQITEVVRGRICSFPVPGHVLACLMHWDGRAQLFITASYYWMWMEKSYRNQPALYLVSFRVLKLP